MIYRIYTVYDSKAEAYMQPFFMLSKGLAIRSFAEACNDKSSNLGKYPEDFTLFEIGTYDDQYGVVVNHDIHVSMGVGVEFTS